MICCWGGRIRDFKKWGGRPSNWGWFWNGGVDTPLRTMRIVMSTFPDFITIQVRNAVLWIAFPLFWNHIKANIESINMFTICLWLSRLVFLEQLLVYDSLGWFSWNSCLSMTLLGGFSAAVSSIIIWTASKKEKCQ